MRQQREWLGFTKFGLLSWKTFKTLYLSCFWQLSIVINNNPYLYTIYLIQEPLQMLFCICVVYRCVTARNELALTHPRALLAKFAAKLSDSFLFSLSKRAISWWQRTLKKKKRESLKFTATLRCSNSVWAVFADGLPWLAKALVMSAELLLTTVISTLWIRLFVKLCKDVPSSLSAFIQRACVCTHFFLSFFLINFYDS